MIKSFSCKNFKNVQAENVECAPINLLIGPNNGGKSNFLRALTFCSKMYTPTDKSSPFLSEIKRNGGKYILRHGAESRDISLGWVLDVMGDTLDYRVVFTVSESSGEVSAKEQSLKIIQPDGTVTDVSNSSLGTWFQERNLLHLDHGMYFVYTIFKTVYLFSSSDFSFSAIRQPQITGIGERILSGDGSNFLNVYQTAASQDKSFVDRFERKVRQLIDGLESVAVESVADMAAMRLRFNDGSFWLSQVSDGTIEALLLALLLSMPGEMAPSVLAIDEPEVNLHPAWQKVIANWIQVYGNVPQCFISTHSPDFLDAFTEGFRRGDVQILVFDSKGSHTVEQLDREKLEPELAKGWMLGDLYRVGDPLIGGWPY